MLFKLPLELKQYYSSRSCLITSTARNIVHSFDIIFLSETYLSSETPPNDTRLRLPDYNLSAPITLPKIKEVFVFITDRPFL